MLLTQFGYGKLNSLGLLSGSFLLGDQLQELKTYYNRRQHLVEQLARGFI